ncbi:hypothetical protein QVH35_03905 [Candidatus Nitrosotenuis chungbukensis]|uniref:dTMP kinase n=1 Tax=Candidatus Nitrosotenuis chungbukensis TaxID=1353246 RepID=UPI0026710EF2|nr:hypothetical protein [Candidatus Nitrosotenuis chungbukensis]WKT58533.1 hypothetical protein QVH35_03905 [Candidatus Nitrosotenuis chungbukensis]
MHGKRKFSPQVIHCLLAANRWEKLQEIKKAHSENSVLIMNRYYQSNLVYGAVNKANLKWLQNLDEGLPKSDLVIVLDVSQKESFNRKKSKRDKFEKDRKFLDQISKTYRKACKEARLETSRCFTSKRRSTSIHNGNNCKKDCKTMKPFLDIVDPIHNFIRVYETELKIIDSPIFQRLRRIRRALRGAPYLSKCSAFQI